jgi:hypothetical protein
MPGRPQTRQKATAGNDVYAAGRDLIINDGAGTTELGPPGLLPRDVPGFTGRDDELARLAALAGGGRVVVSAIGGTAGVGKTALAVHAAHRLLEEFPDGHLYADLRGYTAGQDPAEPGEGAAWPGSRMLAGGGGGHARCRRPRPSPASGPAGCEHPVPAPPPLGPAPQAAILIFPSPEADDIGLEI